MRSTWHPCKRASVRKHAITKYASPNPYRNIMQCLMGPTTPCSWREKSGKTGQLRKDIPEFGTKSIPTEYPSRILPLDLTQHHKSEVNQPYQNLNKQLWNYRSTSQPPANQFVSQRLPHQSGSSLLWCPRLFSDFAQMPSGHLLQGMDRTCKLIELIIDWWFQEHVQIKSANTWVQYELVDKNHKNQQSFLES